MTPEIGHRTYLVRLSHYENPSNVPVGSSISPENANLGPRSSLAPGGFSAVSGGCVRDIHEVYRMFLRNDLRDPHGAYALP